MSVYTAPPDPRRPAATPAQDNRGRSAGCAAVLQTPAAAPKTESMGLPPLITVSIAALTAVAAPAAVGSLAATGHHVKAHRSATAYDELEAAAPGRVARAVVGGVAAWRVSVKPGDAPTDSGERTEMVWSQARTGGSAGAAMAYRWSARFPSGFRYVKSSTWNIFAQFHGTAADGCHPNLALQIDAKGAVPMLRLQSRGGALNRATCRPEASPSWDFAALDYDRWYRFGLKVRWSADPSVGSVELTVDGRTVVPATRTATLYDGQGVYLKQGFYRAPSSFDSVLYETTPTIAPLTSSASYRR